MNPLRKVTVTASILLASSSIVLAQQLPTFNDVPEDYWAFSYIEQFAALGITSGCGGGNFCPDATVTRAQMAVFVIRAIDAVFEHHSFVSVPGVAVRSWDVAGGFVPGVYERDGAVYISEPGVFVGFGSVQLPDRMRILGMTCMGRYSDEASLMAIALSRHPIGAPEQDAEQFIATMNNPAFGFSTEFSRATAVIIDPNATTVDNANFTYSLFVHMIDGTVASPFVDGAAVRGCSIEMAR